MDNAERLVPPAEPVVVAMPEEIDIANSGVVGRGLSLALLLGAPVVIADFTATVFCGSCGIWELAQAHRLAADMNAELRLAVPSKAVLRVLELTGLDFIVPVYSSLAAARAASTVAEEAPRPPEAA